MADALNQLARAPVVSSVADALVKMFMVGASSDGCNFTAALPRSAEVAAAVRNAIELLGSWEPVQQVAPPLPPPPSSRRAPITFSLTLCLQDAWAMQREA